MLRNLAAVTAMLAVCSVLAFSQDAPEAPATEGEVLVVTAIWPGQDLTHTRFLVFADAAMKDLVDVFPAGGSGGSGMLALRQGEYYLMALVDVNGNNKTDAGDGFGFYGVDDCSAATRPQPLKVGPAQPHVLSVRILMTMDDQGHLRPVALEPGEPAAAAGSIVGTVTGAGDRQAIVLLPADEGLTPLACLVGEDGSFELHAAAGTYKLIVVADADDSGSITDQDLVGWKGPEDGEGLDDLTVDPGETLDAGEVALSPGKLPIEAEELPAVLLGRVPGASLALNARAELTLYDDAEFKSLVHKASAGADGSFCAALEAGTYYAKVTVDFDANGVMSAGDMVGFFGVSDILSGEKPQPLVLAAGDLRQDVVIPLTAQLDGSGRLVAMTATDDAADDAQDEGAEDDGGR